jgi:hypothetical protein
MKVDRRAHCNRAPLFDYLSFCLAALLVFIVNIAQAETPPTQQDYLVFSDAPTIQGSVLTSSDQNIQ